MQSDNFFDAQYDQMIHEEELLTRIDQSCSPNTLKVRMANLNTLNPPNVHRIASGVRNEFYNYQFMNWLSCSIRYTFTARGSATGLAKPDAVQNFIQSLRPLTVSSGAGLVWEASFGGIRQIILLKTPKTIVTDVHIFHEFFVGTLFTNQLRQHLPHFMFVYGLFKCTRPKFTQATNTVATSFCQSTKVIDIYDELSVAEIATLERTEREIDRQRQLKNFDEVNLLEELLQDLYGKYGSVLDNPVNYLVIENIPGGLTLSENLKLPTTTFKDVISYLLQLSIALDWALHEHDFCHYDLHTDNLIMRHIGIMGQETFVEMNFYGQPEVKRKISTRYIPTIIDYGRSHVSYQNQESGREEHFGYYLAPQWGIYYNRSRPIYDLYKLIGFIVFEIFKSYRNKPALPVDYSDLNSSMSLSGDILTKTVPMSISDYPAQNLIPVKRSYSEIENELEAVAIARRIPDETFNQMVSLMSFFPFFKDAYGQVPKTEVILFILREFEIGRFSIGDRWPDADQLPFKFNLYRSFYDYLTSRPFGP